MRIYGRDVPTPDGIWQLYSQIIQSPDLWAAGEFKGAAVNVGFRKIAPRQGYLSFSGKNYMTGQAIIVDDFIEEIRLFIGSEPKDLTEMLYKEDRGKIPQLASEYSALFRQKLGEPRIAHDNDIFEYNDHRVRVLSSACVWVVISKLSVIRQLPNDWWLHPST
jgi:hypothetical protein